MMKIQKQKEQQTATISVINSDNNSNTKQPKFSSFSMTYISGYFEQFINDRTSKKNDRIKATTVMAIVITISNILNSSFFLLIINLIILNNLQLR